MQSYATGDAPHIRAQDTSSGMQWGFWSSLLPALLVSLILYRWEAARLLGCSVSAAILSEILAKKIFRKDLMLHDGSSIFIGTLFAMMCPLQLPLGIVALGSFFSVFVGKELFGGTGEYVLHPALVGQIFIHTGFPISEHFMTLYGVNGVTWSDIYGVTPTWSWKALLGLGPTMMADGSTLPLLAGAIMLVGKRLIHWEVPILFLISLAAVASVLGLNPIMSLFAGNACFAAFFLVSDPVTTPMTRSGARFFAIACGVLVGALRFGSGYFYILPFAVLIMNALTPWIDARIRPRYAMNT
jgi:Na+-translocating ferredoxin:NAD+ oxidoreductase subunit D